MCDAISTFGGTCVEQDGNSRARTPWRRLVGQRKALLVATYEYEDTGLRQLTAPARDAEALATVLADEEVAGFQVTTLINQPHYRIGEAISELYRGRRRNDLTVLYFTPPVLDDNPPVRDDRKHSEAEVSYREAVRLDPGNAVMHRNLGSALYYQQHYPDAEAAAREALRLDPEYAPAHSTLGDVQYALKQYADAEASYRQAIRLDPADPWAHNGLGNALKQLKR